MKNMDFVQDASDSRVYEKITEKDIPQGDDAEVMKRRQQLILRFYAWWGSVHPDKKVFNEALQEDIFVSYKSKMETSRHASRRYESTLAVLHLDEILAGAVPILSARSDPRTKSQSRFERLILMKYSCEGIGTVKLTVGVYKKTHQKEQYCITVIEAEAAAEAFRQSSRHSNKKRTGGGPAR